MSEEALQAECREILVHALKTVMPIPRDRPTGTKVTVAFTNGKETESCYLELRGELGAFVPLGWLEDDEEYDNGRDFQQYWKDFHRVTEGAFEDLGDRTVYIPANRIAYIRPAT